MGEIVVSRLVGDVAPVSARQHLFIGCSSFEPRCAVVAGRIAPSELWRRAIIFRSAEYRSLGESQPHFESLSAQALRFSGVAPLSVTFGLDRPAEFIDVVRENLLAAIAREPTHVVCDITTFPRQELIVLIRLLREVGHSLSLDVYYTDAGQYATEHPDGWLTRGVRSVTPIVGFGGVQPPGKKKLLLMLLGHEPERSAITWKRHQPFRTILVKTAAEEDSTLPVIVDALHKEVFELLAGAEVISGLPAHGVMETRDLVLRIAWANAARMYTIVAPLGTKLQTLGAALAAMEDRRIQLSYAVPAVYNYESYSVNYGDVWRVEGVA
jgi:hypothetical protein